MNQNKIKSENFLGRFENNKIINVNPNMSVITINVQGANLPVKRQRMSD